VRGEVVVAATGGDPDRFKSGTVLSLDDRGIETLTVMDRRHLGDGVALRFEGRPDRDAVMDLPGHVLHLESSKLPALPDGEFYHFQLVGLSVTRSDGTQLGEVIRILSIATNDLYEVQGASGTVLIPGRKEFVAWIDLEKGEMRLTDRADLLEAQGEQP
jgi:16S rRNA processing protein RimM